MKLTLEVYETAESLAELCHMGEDRCPIGGGTIPIACPFCKFCDDITPEDWKKLEVEDEDV